MLFFLQKLQLQEKLKLLTKKYEEEEKKGTDSVSDFNLKSSMRDLKQTYKEYQSATFELNGYTKEVKYAWKRMHPGMVSVSRLWEWCNGTHFNCLYRFIYYL